MVKLEITTHSSNEVDIIEVEQYDAQHINQLRNDDGILAVLIGENSYSRIDLKNIKVISAESA
ncbi:hypothetical protein [Caldibacillus thermoamylovorans]|uniref:hypothetical protein n=1 Tax=Caldibacillus thermoamylovorans TaxID=35841 RepID=UPI00203C6844|nr:hypothetical protein [Caldibacillus thermoamylovorans]MCM3053664.1 hypothetical protein [Caldibacillus thermoamylovorans]